MLVEDFAARYGIFIVSALILLRIVYFRISPNREAYFGLFMFGNGVFFVTYLLHSVEMSMGFAFGLFAVFAMLRYRTEAIGIRDMTYLFITIVISLMCAVAELRYFETGVLATIIIALAAFAETQVFAPTVVERTIVYDRVDKIHPHLYPDLLQELRERTGMNIVKFEVGKINFLDDSVLLTVFCEKGKKNTANLPE